MARWPVEALRAAVSPLLPGFTVEVLPRIDSTNSELMRRARAGRCAPQLLVAEWQTAGRGRMGRSWQGGAQQGLEQTRAVAQEQAPPGAIASLMMSLALPLAPRDWSGLSLAVGVSVVESLQAHWPARDGGQRARLGLKWPNDLWLGDATGEERKLGGILVETASFVAPQRLAAQSPERPSATGLNGVIGKNSDNGNARYVVVGIGINVLPRSAEGMSMPPGSLQEIEPGLDAGSALLRIVAPLVGMLQSFEGYGFAPMQPRFAARDMLQGRAVTLSDGQSGTAHGVSEDGALLVHTASGMRAISSAEISVRPTALPLPAAR